MCSKRNILYLECYRTQYQYGMSMKLSAGHILRATKCMVKKWTNKSGSECECKRQCTCIAHFFLRACKGTQIFMLRALRDHTVLPAIHTFHNRIAWNIAYDIRHELIHFAVHFTGLGRVEA
jgi:hypothetical protein